MITLWCRCTGCPYIYHVMVPDDIMSLMITLWCRCTGETRGLMGFFDGNPVNDLIEQDGTMVGPDPTPQRVHDFGETCKYRY